MDSSKFIFKDVLIICNPAKKLFHDPLVFSTAKLNKAQGCSQRRKGDSYSNTAGYHTECYAMYTSNQHIERYLKNL